MADYFDNKSLPIDALFRGWKIFVIGDDNIFSIVDRDGHVLFTWYRAPSLGEVREKAEELIAEEVSA
jgi:hypothetical protein